SSMILAYTVPQLLLSTPRPPSSPLFPYTTLFRSDLAPRGALGRAHRRQEQHLAPHAGAPADVAPDQQVLQHGGVFEQLDVLEGRSEEHTSELQSRENLVCRLLLETKINTKNIRLR